MQLEVTRVVKDRVAVISAVVVPTLLVMLLLARIVSVDNIQLQAFIMEGQLVALTVLQEPHSIAVLLDIMVDIMLDMVELHVSLVPQDHMLQ